MNKTTYIGLDVYKDTIAVATRGRSLDRKRLSFWRLILDLPGEQVDRWLEERAANPWENRWGE